MAFLFIKYFKKYIDKKNEKGYKQKRFEFLLNFYVSLLIFLLYGTKRTARSKEL